MNAREEFWGPYIAAYRKRNGLSQEDLGQRLKVSAATISRWEKGRQLPDLESQKTLSAILQIQNQMSLEDWNYRVTNSHGWEILSGMSKGILAISKKAAQVLGLPPEKCIGLRTPEHLTKTPGPLAREFSRHGLDRIPELGLYPGAVRQIYVELDVNFRSFSSTFAADIWSITTSDHFPAALYVAYPTTQPADIGTVDRFRIRVCEITFFPA